MNTAMKRSQRGFTLIEVLVVIGIILVLLGMVVLGFRHLDAVASKRDTVAELHVCRDLLTEYGNLNGLDNLDVTIAANISPKQSKDPNAPGRQLFPVYVDTLNANGTITPQDILPGDTTAGTSVDMGDRGSSSNARYSCNAVLRTQDVMYVLLRVPKNQSMVASLPSKRILEARPSGSSGTPTPASIRQAVILDGWGNPIIFVPRGGLHVMIDNGSGAQEYIVRTSGTFLASQIKQHPLSAADRPFFASAGQDGKFGAPEQGNPKAAYGADNVYSFQD